ncbi:MAG: hypothetical protein ACK5PS_15340 [Desulfopila sp.]
MAKIAQHKVLVAGNAFGNCRDQVLRFFDRTSLVRYDTIQVIDEQCCSGLDADFAVKVEAAERKNRETLKGLIRELQQTGARTIEDLERIELGYPSKVLHVISHLLDGFIGIDSHFYNLITDSHWLEKEVAREIAEDPGRYWLIHLDCYSDIPEKVGVFHL